MAGRVNTKFVFVLSAVLVALVGALTAFWFVFVQQDPEELIKRGDQYHAEGRYAEAIDSYSRALSRRRNDVELLHKFNDTLFVATVSSEHQAERYVGQIQDNARRISEVARDDASLEAFYSLHWELIRDGLSRYDRLHQLADRRVQDDPENLVARRYRGMTQVHRLADRPREEHEQARRDLERALEARPEDAELQNHLVRWKLFEAAQLDQPGGNRPRAAELRQEAFDLSEQMFEQDRTDPHRTLMHIQVLLDPGVNRREEAEPLLEALEAYLLDDPRPRHIVLHTIDLLPRVDQSEGVRALDRPVTRGIERALELLEAAVETYPEEIAYRVALGRYMTALGHPNEAIEHFETARQMMQHAPALTYMRTRQLRLEATLQKADLLIGQLAVAETDEQRQAKRSEIESLRDEAAERMPDAPSIRMINAKLAVVDNNLVEAAILFDEASEQYERRNPEALRLGAVAYRRLGDWGAAVERLNRLAEVQPGNLATHLELADIYLSAGRARDAEQSLALVLEQQPGNQRALRLQAQLHARRGQPDQAIELLEQLDWVQDPQLVAQLVQVYASSERPDEAVAALERRLAEAPDDMRAVQMMIGLGGEDFDPAPLFAQAREAGANERAVSRLERLHGGEEISLEEAIAEALAERDDPLERAMLQIEIARRQGDRASLSEAVAEAERHDATSARVIELQFELALSEQDWGRAQRYADRARDHDIDEAQGAFYAGRLAASQGELREAIAHFGRGLSARPVYSDGWRFMGDARRLNGDYEGAAAAYGTAVEQRPNNVQALRGLAASQDALGQHDRALARIREALQYSPNDLQLIEQYLRYEQEHGDPERALHLRQQLAEVSPERYDNRRAMALLLAARGETEAAVEAAEALLVDEGTTRNNVAALAEVHRRLGQADEGLALLEQYLDDRGDEVDASDYLTLARFKLMLNDGPGVQSAYDRAKALDTDDQQPVAREYADLLFERGAFAEAAEEYERLHDAMPDDAGVALRLAESKIQFGETDAAEALLEALPDDARQLALRAIVARMEGDHAEAASLIDRAIARDRAEPLLYVERARQRSGQGADPAAVIEDVNEALRLAPGLVPARMLLVQAHLARGNARDARRELRTLLTHNPRVAEARVMLLELYVEAGEMRSAEQLLEASANLFPEDATWPRLRAQLASRAGQSDAALGHWRRAVELSATPGHVGGLARQLLNDERADEALEVLAEHGATVDRFALLQALRGQVLAALGQSGAAESAFGSAMAGAGSLGELSGVGAAMVQTWGVSDALQRIETLPGEAPALTRQLAAAQVEIGSNQFERAALRLQGIEAELRQADEALQVVANQMLGLALYRSGSHAEAAAAYQRVLDMKPDDVATLNNLSFLLADALDEPERALPLAERAAELTTDDARVLDTLGWVQYKLGLHQEGRQTLEQALAIEPLAATYLHLGTLHLEQGDPELASELLTETASRAERNGEADLLERANELLERANRQLNQIQP